jgi:CRISPR-associated endonuclease/helicase Cas3
VDAGVAYLSSFQEIEAAIAVYSHHIGLCDLVAEAVKAKRNSQDTSQYPFRDPRVKLHTDAHLAELVQRHRSAVGCPVREYHPQAKLGGFGRRLLLSSLLDADHTDTAQNYGQPPDPSPAQPRWGERLASLDKYVQKLRESSGSRNPLRTEVYETCRAASPDEPFWACDSPVGSGKTTAVMAYLLQAAIKLDLRHIFVVLPYTNIVEQAVDVYRRSLVLTDEDPSQIVTAPTTTKQSSSAQICDI